MPCPPKHLLCIVQGKAMPLSHFLDGVRLAQVPRDLLSISQQASVIIARQPVGSVLQPDIREGTWM